MLLSDEKLQLGDSSLLITDSSQLLFSVSSMVSSVTPSMGLVGVDHADASSRFGSNIVD